MLPPSAAARHHIFLLHPPAYPRRQNLAVSSKRLTRTPWLSALPAFVVAVVDDDQGILRSLEYLLESADYAVRLFTSGTALLHSRRLREIDCLISDIDMPGMDGFELLRLVHAARPGLPIILITGYPDTLKRLPADGSKPRVLHQAIPGAGAARGRQRVLAKSARMKDAPLLGCGNWLDTSQGVASDLARLFGGPGLVAKGGPNAFVEAE